MFKPSRATQSHEFFSFEVKESKRWVYSYMHKIIWMIEIYYADVNYAQNNAQG